eukprot:SAG31_NODE_3767_length_3902_cov_1.591375_6_plen_222_part_00
MRHHRASGSGIGLPAAQCPWSRSGFHRKPYELHACQPTCKQAGKSATNCIDMGKRSKEIRAAERERRSGKQQSKVEWERSGHAKREPRKLENAELERFYSAQGIVDPGEWDHFLSACRAPLPICFRVLPGPAAARLQQMLRTDSWALDGLQVANPAEEGGPPFQVPAATAAPAEVECPALSAHAIADAPRVSVRACFVRWPGRSCRRRLRSDGSRPAMGGA